MSQDARETKAYLELALNKPCRVELVTSQIVFIMALSHIRALIFFLYTIENSPMDFSRESQTYFRIRTSVEVRNCTKSESFSKVHGPESLIFQIYVTFSIDFPNIYISLLLLNYRIQGQFFRYTRWGSSVWSCIL